MGCPHEGLIGTVGRCCCGRTGPVPAAGHGAAGCPRAPCCAGQSLGHVPALCFLKELRVAFSSLLPGGAECLGGKTTTSPLLVDYIPASCAWRQDCPALLHSVVYRQGDILESEIFLKYS